MDKKYAHTYAIGPAGTNTHEVAKWLGLPDPTFLGGNLEALRELALGGRADACAVAPIENSTTSLVGDTVKFWLSLLDVSAPGRPQPVYVVGERGYRVRHCLAGKASAVVARQRILSHTQALGQCAGFVATWGLPTAPAKSTAEAAMQAAADPTTLAICSRFAAEHYGLEVIEENIQDEPDNETRFHVVAREPVGPTGRDRTAMMFTLDNRPGMLAHAQLAFGCEGVDLSVSDSIRRGKPGSYVFYVEAACHQDTDVGRRCFTRLRTFTKELLVLGSFPQEGGAE